MTLPIADCGLRIADFEMPNCDCGFSHLSPVADAAVNGYQSAIGDSQSAISHPQSAIGN
jgi:hypothetical protein